MCVVTYNLQLVSGKEGRVMPRSYHLQNTFDLWSFKYFYSMSGLGYQNSSLHRKDMAQDEMIGRYSASFSGQMSGGVW